ncbi:MAG: hypothetical protein JWO06_2241, partial [Bacteroidota bacterium]|nr:hypothetical protein [Bacteroidota bacterium]
MGNQKKHSAKKWFRLLFLLLPVISFLNFLLPWVAKYVANWYMAKMKGYKGKIDQVKIGMGSIILRGFELDKMNRVNGERPLFISAELIEIHFDLKSLWQGAIICEAAIEAPSVRFVRGEEFGGEKSSSPVSSPGFIPFAINRLEVLNGSLEYLDIKPSPVVEFRIGGIDISCSGITNIRNSQEILPSKAEVEAKVMNGTLRATVGMNLLEEEPEFDINLEVKGIDLVLLNSFFNAYGHFTLKQGN